MVGVSVHANQMSDPPAHNSSEGSSLFHIAYVSSAVKPFSAEELLELLKRARARNTAAQVTGILLYHDGNLMQLLEGPEVAVRATHQRILQDPRHTGMIKLIAAPARERLFSDWSMAFRHVSVAELRNIPGFSQFLGWAQRNESLETSHKVLGLLRSFRDRLR